MLLLDPQRADAGGADFNYSWLFRWFVGLDMDEPVWNHAVSSKNRERLLNQDVARGFFDRVLKQAQPYLSDEHFTVDGTLIEAWASQKSFQKKDGGTPMAATFMGTNAATTRMRPRPIQTPVCTARATVKKPSSAIGAMC
jgi:hypothetical protein